MTDLNNQEKDVTDAIEERNKDAVEVIDQKLLTEAAQYKNKDLIKHKLQVHLMKESQKIYQNNLIKFTNGLSLMSVNGVETKGYVKQMYLQSQKIEQATDNIEAHSSYIHQQSS